MNTLEKSILRFGEAAYFHGVASENYGNLGTQAAFAILEQRRTERAQALGDVLELLRDQHIRDEVLR